MQVLKVLFIITALLIISIHISTSIFKRKVAETLSYVNLGLHILLVFGLMALDVAFEYMALVFMLSLLVYLLSSFVVYKVKVERKHSDDL